MDMDSNNDVIIELEASLSKLVGVARLKILTPLIWFLRQSNPQRALLLAAEAQLLLPQSESSDADKKVAVDNLKRICKEAQVMAAEETRINERRLRRKQHLEREQKENEAQWQAAEAALPTAGKYDRLVLPSAPKKISALPQRRRDLYSDHLSAVIIDAFVLKARQKAGQKMGRAELARLSPPKQSDPISDETAAWMGKFCTVCSGGCCTKGKETAYVMVQTIVQYIDAHPTMLPEQVLEAYMARLMPETVTGSCVNHTKQGCSLPRDMRSHVCNNYLCDSLKSFEQRQHKQAGIDAVIVITRKKTNWQRYTDLDNRIIGTDIVDVDGIRPALIGAGR